MYISVIYSRLRNNFSEYLIGHILQVPAYIEITYMCVYIHIYLITIYYYNHITKCITVMTTPTPASRASECWLRQVSSIPQQLSWHPFLVWLSGGPSQPIDQLYCFENNLATGFIYRYFF